MLKTLNNYKTEYKTASSLEQKSHVHRKVMEFTTTWLDAKNLQLDATINN